MVIGPEAGTASTAFPRAVVTPSCDTQYRSHASKLRSKSSKMPCIWEMKASVDAAAMGD